MKRYFIMLFLGNLLLANSVVASCLEYEPNIIEVSGTLVREIYPGRPNYESIINGDESVTVWVLKLKASVCVVESDEINIKEDNETEIQLVLDQNQYKKYQSLIGSSVSVTGKLFHSHTGHHYKRLLLNINDIKNS